MDSLSKWIANQGFTVLLIIAGSWAAYYFGGKLVELITHKIVEGGRRRNIPKKDIEKRSNTVASLMVTIWRILIAAIAIISVFKTLFSDIDLSPLFASAGIVGIAIAFGAQSLVKDFLTGVFIISENQYRVGDIVDIGGASGQVERIGTRSTVLRDDDGNVHYVPNGTVTHVINKTMGYSKVRFSILLDSGTDLDNAITVINQAGDALADSPKWKAKVLSPPQFDSIGTFSAKSVEVTIVGKVQPSDQWAITAAMRRKLLKEFEKHNIIVA